MLRKELGKVYSLPFKEREKVLQVLSKELESRREIVFAVVFGSFLTSKVFHDIDIGIYLYRPCDVLRDYEYAENLSRELEKKVNLPIDVVVLNHTPMWLKYRALKGKVIVDRDPILRLALKLAAIDNMLSRAGI